MTGIMELEKLNAYISLGSQYVDLTIKRKSVWVGLKRDSIIDKINGDESKNEDFMTDSSTTMLAEVSENESEEAMVVAMAIEERSKSNHKDIVGNYKLIKREHTVAEKGITPEYQ